MASIALAVVSVVLIVPASGFSNLFSGIPMFIQGSWDVQVLSFWVASCILGSYLSSWTIGVQDLQAKCTPINLVRSLALMSAYTRR